jgi:putative FmdB family regulatory protein
VPTYDYQCRSCGNRIEVLHGVNNSGPTACTVCGGPMRKLLSSPTIVFKGSGWAKKDRSTKPTASSSDDTKAADTEKKTDTDTKAETAGATTSTTEATSSTTKTTSKGGAGSSD